MRDLLDTCATDVDMAVALAQPRIKKLLTQGGRAAVITWLDDPASAWSTRFLLFLKKSADRQRAREQVMAGL